MLRLLLPFCQSCAMMKSNDALFGEALESFAVIV